MGEPSPDWVVPQIEFGHGRGELLAALRGNMTTL